MASYWEKFESRIERRFDLLGAALGAVAFFYFFGGKPVSPTIGKLLDASVNISAIAVGFLMTAKTILLGANDQRIVQKLRELGTFPRLMRFLIAAIWWCFLSTVASAVLILLDPGAAGITLVTIWMFVASGAVFSCFRAIWIFNKVLRQFH